MNRITRTAGIVVFSVATFIGGASFGMNASDLPDRAPRDAVMASAAEVQEIHEWAARAFADLRPERAGNEVKLEARRQDHNTLHFGESCMETPIKIGSRAFERGLGTHANSEIVVTLPQGATAFKAFVGVDNNYDTQGTKGSVQFGVELGGQEVFHTQTLKGGEDPVAVNVQIPTGTSELVLKVETTEDGPSCDQADWADAHLVMADGSRKWLDERRPRLLLGKATPPFSFNYGGTPSGQFLASWKHAANTVRLTNGVRHEATWEDPKTGLAVTATVTVFNDYPALDWVLHFENRGSQDTPILEEIRAADLEINAGDIRRALVSYNILMFAY